jgi:hypothetical protein
VSSTAAALTGIAQRRVERRPSPHAAAVRRLSSQLLTLFVHDHPPPPLARWYEYNLKDPCEFRPPRANVEMALSAIGMRREL